MPALEDRGSDQRLTRTVTISSRHDGPVLVD